MSHSPKLEGLRIARADKPPRSSSRLALATVVAVVLLLAISAFWWFARRSDIEVRVVAAKETSGPAADRTVLNASGYVTARRVAMSSVASA